MAKKAPKRPRPMSRNITPRGRRYDNGGKKR